MTRRSISLSNASFADKQILAQVASIHPGPQRKPTKRELECLFKRNGYSRSEAKAMVEAGWPAVNGDIPDHSDTDPERMLDAIREGFERVAAAYGAGND